MLAWSVRPPSEVKTRASMSRRVAAPPRKSWTRTPGESRARILSARRRMLMILCTLTVAALGIAVIHLAAWWVTIPPILMLGGYIMLLREASRADAEHALLNAAAYQDEQDGRRDAREAREAEAAGQAEEARRVAAEAAAAEAEHARVIDISDARAGRALRPVRRRRTARRRAIEDGLEGERGRETGPSFATLRRSLGL